MSTFGGDSWVPENVHRKRRVEELLRDEIEDDQMRRLSNGRLACLVCPNWPVLDNMHMLHMHRKGARHQASAEKHREKQQQLHQEIQKRMALGSLPAIYPSNSSSHVEKKTTAPLLSAAKRIKAAVLDGEHDNVSGMNNSPGNGLHGDAEIRPYVRKQGGAFFELTSGKTDSGAASNMNCPAPPEIRKLVLNSTKPGGSARALKGRKQKHSKGFELDLAHQVAAQEMKRELRFKEAGWKRDGVGGWSRDENVEFDSDEEVPVHFH